ncbi:HAMP domain-containing sensor histidine kinase [Ekhidna sp.]|uniref:sensor histidine kinase n=1 Tax=Ekhidna sp. TaxID=2608089 RepID=UPI0032975AC1
MSVLKEEDLRQRLQLFESTVSHASITWNDLEKVCVVERSKDFLLPEGEFNLIEIIDEVQLEVVKEFHESISDSVNQAFILLNYLGKKITIKCCAKKKDDKIGGLWVVVPEKDNSIRYLQNAAHDFRAPLGSVIGVVNLMQHTIKSDSKIDIDELVTFLDMIKFSTDKAMNLASEILELAKIESETYELKTDKVVAKDFVQRYLDTHRLLTLKKRIQVVFDSHTDASAMLNESTMTRALDNVMTNSVKFSEEGTQITITLREENDKVFLNITDQGIGMSERILDNLFVKFGEAKRNGLKGEPTHGLGMSIVRQIMKLHNGEVIVKSEEMKGTQVDLILKKG